MRCCLRFDGAKLHLEEEEVGAGVLECAMQFVVLRSTFEDFLRGGFEFLDREVVDVLVSVSFGFKWLSARKIHTLISS